MCSHSYSPRPLSSIASGSQLTHIIILPHACHVPQALSIAPSPDHVFHLRYLTCRLLLSSWFIYLCLKGPISPLLKLHSASVSIQVLSPGVLLTCPIMSSRHLTAGRSNYPPPAPLAPAHKIAMEHLDKDWDITTPAEEQASAPPGSVEAQLRRLCETAAPLHSIWIM
ncbi:hypothetical protein AAFF_G00254350 [Aldrovandia affinis]|uniref:Uncharacterized protein n=1 Tax=Aldrovandia affinis TaxID=143900 RepID=A0AAD7RCP4_9TELE|nr:hypothetical protein AAFF_G00254350 [Aldrovandia affinis]